jgi:hypothetical protein
VRRRRRRRRRRSSSRRVFRARWKDSKGSSLALVLYSFNSPLYLSHFPLGPKDT